MTIMKSLNNGHRNAEPPAPTARSLADTDRREMLYRQIARLSHQIKTLEHDYADLLAGPDADLYTVLHCCRVALERAAARRPPTR